ncbi:hypothetical protein J2Y58_002722 [Sphingomonas sp. BE138]|nr:hypothetical protein [Sphingomonas sp. BE138]
MVARYNFSPRRRAAVLAALIVGSWSVIALAADAAAHLVR